MRPAPDATIPPTGASTLAVPARARLALAAIVPAGALLLLFEGATRVARTTPSLLQPLAGWPHLQGVLSAILIFAIVNVPLVLAERLWPGTRQDRRYADGARFWLIYIVVSYAWSQAAVSLSSRIATAPLLSLTLGSDSNALAIAAGILGTVAIFDFFYYWFHRAQHHFRTLWSFHSVHHSIVHLNCVNSYHHALEEVFRFPVMSVPLALLIRTDVPQLVLLSAFVAAWAQYIHSDTRVSFGRVWPVFSDNRYHRIHHSSERRHVDKNFAAFFPVWDRLFGTYHAPEPTLVVDVGLADVPPPAAVSEYLLMPFRARPGNTMQDHPPRAHLDQPL